MIMAVIVESYETASGSCPMKMTNFDKYLDEQLKDPEFAARFERAGEAWDVALQIAALRNEAGLSQKHLAKLLHARVRVTDEPEKKTAGLRVAETAAAYRAKRTIRRHEPTKQVMSKVK